MSPERGVMICGNSREGRSTGASQRGAVKPRQAGTGLGGLLPTIYPEHGGDSSRL